MNKGFTLIEVVVALAIIVVIGTMMIYAYVGSLQASKDLYFREQTKLTLLEYIDYCDSSKFLPKIIDGNQIWMETHIINQNMFNDGTNSKLTTFFGPIDKFSLSVNSFNGIAWIPVSSTATDSGAVIIPGIHQQVRISYQVLGWNYIKDRRFNYGNSILLSYIRPKLDSLVTDDGIDIPVTNAPIFNSEEGRIVVNIEQNKWINIYYKVPRDIIIKIYRPNVESYSFNSNMVIFNNKVSDHYLLINYQTVSGELKTQIVKANSFNQAVLSDNIYNINKIRCLTIEGTADFKSGKFRKVISYKKVILGE